MLTETNSQKDFLNVQRHLLLITEFKYISLQTSSLVMHLSVLSPRGQGPGIGWGFDKLGLPQGRVFDMLYTPG